jgi:broad specificity phosphatase PhoE
MSRRILLIRHAPVALRWHGRCYGHTDAGLSRAGTKQSREIARAISGRRDAEEISAVIHSGQRRAAYLAGLIAAAAGVEFRMDERWRERDFGAWEGRSWNSIWRNTGADMDRMLTEPRRFRPGGGETTAELFARSVLAWRALPKKPHVVVVTHGGPIACVRCQLAGADFARLPEFRIREGECFEWQE